MNSQERSIEKSGKVVEEVIGLLRQHKENLRGTIHQDPYKSDFFRLFADAYNAGLMDQNILRADALADSVAERDTGVTKDEPFLMLITFWREWTYAWDRRGQLHR